MATPDLSDLLPIALDMTASLTAADRSRRLVAAVDRALPCDAAVLLRLDGAELVPVAARGTSPDLLGRRFRLDEHPRLDAICRAHEPVVFPAESELPDPYDGLIEGEPDLHVHSCLGCALRVDGELVGALTADALRPGVFDGVDRGFLAHLAALAAAALRTSDLIEALEQRARHEGQVAQQLVADVLERRGGLLVGNSEPMVRLRDELDLVARAELPVLVTGETGTGKELVVRMLHARSPRRERPLVYVNCAALPESIAESELFGHTRGAFTGAGESRPGKFRVADGATLFLDEIGELPLHLQPKLLRALQEGEVQPVGSDHTERVDVRILAATNRDLRAEVATGRFRADLFHRLDVCRLHVPPLREHADDIAQLAGHFADRARRRLGTGPVRLDPDAQTALRRGRWPGNVRELENVIARAVLHAAGRVDAGAPVIVRASDVGDVDGGASDADGAFGAWPHGAGVARVAGEASGVRASGSAAPGAHAHGPDASGGRDATTSVPVLPPEGTSLRQALADYQRAAVRAALAACDENWAAAARRLGMHRSNLHHLARRLGLR
ncbi:MAG: nitric oxide reductase transcriptional regulator NorR [Planctomycetes bacterium]|nr:nitric oxide reductase transcriptional regulator NorR [Planctomycetota bacterium]